MFTSMAPLRNPLPMLLHAYINGRHRLSFTLRGACSKFVLISFTTASLALSVETAFADAAFMPQLPQETYAQTAEPLADAEVDPGMAGGSGYERLDELNVEAPRESMVTETEQSLLRKVLWYLPNRLIDLVDIFKFDIGAGASAGVVLRATRYGQMGARVVEPVSVRVGLRGRELPFFFERQSEYGIGPNFKQSPARSVTPLELGVGADLGLAAYAGFSLDELADFLVGFALYDLKHDDLVPMLEP